MSYSVELKQKVAEKISGWGPSSHVIGAILRGLDRLALHPNQQLIRVGPPHDKLQFDLPVLDPATPDYEYLYAFTVLYGADEESLIVVDCERLVEDRLNRPPDDDPVG
jgi:hypothetical protein